MGVNQNKLEGDEVETLRKEQNDIFQRKFQNLKPALQDYSRKKFLSLPVEKQEYAYLAFLTLDQETLERVIEKEMRTEINAEARKQLGKTKGKEITEVKEI